MPERPLLTPMYGPTVRCKGEFGDGQVVLRQCIRPRRGASLLRAMMGIGALVLMYGPARCGRLGHLGTTQRYIEVNDEMKRAAVEIL